MKLKIKARIKGEKRIYKVTDINFFMQTVEMGILKRDTWTTFDRDFEEVELVYINISDNETKITNTR